MKPITAIMIPRSIRELWKNIIYFYLFVLFNLLLQRLFFFFSFKDSLSLNKISFSEIFFSFLIGIRFDLATLPVWLFFYHLFLFMGFLIFSYFSLSIKKYAMYCLSLFFFQSFFILHLSITNLSSILNYEVNNKHLGWEYFAYFRDLPLFIKSSFYNSPFIMSSIFIIIFLWFFFTIFFVIKIYKYNTIDNLLNNKVNFIKLFINFFIYFILQIIFIRGGIQQSPIRPADALTSNYQFLNNLKLNGIFTILHDSSDSDDFRLYYPVQENLSFIREFLKSEDPFISNEYPLLRYMPPRKLLKPEFQTIQIEKKTDVKYNFIIIILESWSAKFLKIHGYKEEVAPNFNRFIEKGIYFKNFFASGGRSANGIFCILTGIPDRAGRTIFRSNQIFNRFGSLALILKERGYKTIFTHSGDLNFDNLRTTLPVLGFDLLIGSEEIKKTEKYKKTWAMGYFDEDLYDISFELIQHLNDPFLLVIFTSNNHHPYTIPDERFSIFPETDPERNFKNSYYYSDYSLGIFIRKLESSKIFNNTIVIMVADHTHHTNLNFYEDRQIPFLIYAPHIFKNKIMLEFASQLDILPTILSINGGDVIYSSMGRDLTRKHNFNYAFFAGGSNTDIIGMIEYPFIGYHYFHSKEKFLFKIDQEINYNNVANKYTEISQSLDYKIKNFYQFARYIEQKNMVWPEIQKYQLLKSEYINKE